MGQADAGDNEAKLMTKLVYLDFMKAFDTVPLRLLINKLGSCGIGVSASMDQSIPEQPQPS